jgi:hypothetical protein
MQDIRDGYIQESYDWYDFDDWYMDSFHLWDDNHFHLLFDNSTPPCVEHILGNSQKDSLNPIFYFSYCPVLVDEFLARSTYLDPHDQC